MSQRRLLVVSHPGVIALNQQIYAALMDRDWDVRLVIPRRWRHEYTPRAFESEVLPALEGRVDRLPIVLPGRPQRHIYLRTPVDRHRPDVALLEEETFSLAALQWGIAAHRRGLPFGVQADENLDRPLPAVARFARRHTLAHASLVTARSPAAATRVREWGFTGDAPVVPHPVSFFRAAARWTQRPSKFTVGFAGRLVQEKGVGDLIEAARRLTAPVRLLIVGDGPLRGEIEKVRIPGCEVVLLTGVRHAEMPDAYAQMDVLVLPSRTTERWAEQFGRVLVESLRCGVPVVGSDSGEIPWVISSTGGGRTFHEGDVPALVEVLEELRADPKRRRDLAECGRSNAERLFSVDAVAAQLDDALVSLLRKRPSRSRGTRSPALKPRRRIALVAHAIHDGGGMEHAWAQLLRRASRDYDVVVIASQLAPELRRLAAWRRVPVPKRPIPLKFVMFYLVAGVRLARQSVDLTHALGAIVPNRVDIAAVHYCHVGFRRRIGIRAPSGGPPFRRLNKAITTSLSSAAERWCYRPGRVRVLTAVSRGLSNELSEAFPGVAKVVIPNGVELARFAPDSGSRLVVRNEFGVREGEALALFVGGDWDHKGLTIAIRALAEARADGGPDVLLWVVGAGDVRRHTHLAASLGVDVHVRFFGVRQDVERFYRAADLFVLPTLYETFSLATYQALAAGLPVVVPRVSGVEDLFDGEPPGILIERTPGSVASALLELAGDAEKRAEMGRVGRSIVERYTWERSVDATLALYCELLDEKPRVLQPAS